MSDYLGIEMLEAVVHMELSNIVYIYLFTALAKTYIATLLILRHYMFSRVICEVVSTEDSVASI